MIRDDAACLPSLEQRRGTLRGKKNDLQRALEGTFIDDQRLPLDKDYVSWRGWKRTVVTLEQKIARRVARQRRTVHHPASVDATQSVHATPTVEVRLLGPDC